MNNFDYKLIQKSGWGKCEVRMCLEIIIGNEVRCAGASVEC